MNGLIHHRLAVTVRLGVLTRSSTNGTWSAAFNANAKGCFKMVFQCVFVFSFCCLLLAPLPVLAKDIGCFDNRRFCFELSPSTSSLYLVSVQRKVSLPVVLTLYSDKLFQLPSDTSEPTPQFHANAFLNTDESVPLGVTEDPNTFWASMRVKWTVGRLNANHDSDYPYFSPLQPADSYHIVQGFNGEFSHSGPSRYALDFAAPIGTPVLAAREGIVIDMKEDGTKGGPTPDFAQYANYVAILHTDGTTGEYYHLKHEGVAVTLGQTVQRGQLIGYTGNTGFSSLPHLHFGIYVAKYHGKYVSVPFSFADTSINPPH